MNRRSHFDLLVVGGGPAGMAAAWVAAQHGARVGVVDENPALGGQIWRGGAAKTEEPGAAPWFARTENAPIELFTGMQVVDISEPGRLVAQTSGGAGRLGCSHDAEDAHEAGAAQCPGPACELHYDRLVLATGAREQFVPFPGWTLPGVVGAGGLQALCKAGVPVEGRRVVVAGSGPLLLAVGAYMVRHGAEVPVIAEQAPLMRLAMFGTHLLTHPSKIVQGAGYGWHTRRARYRTSCWPVAAEGDDRVRAVKLRAGRRTWTEPCDLLACGFGFVPNVELASLLGCRIEQGNVVVDSWQQTSQPKIYCAGEPTGVGGVELALVEGQIAGHAALGHCEAAERLFGARKRGQHFSTALNHAFRLRDQLRDLADAKTIICRCEDVTRERLEQFGSWREAKMHTRCGMGPCQGRVCGPAAQFLLGFRHESVRPPALPTPIAVLACQGENDAE